MKNEVKEELSTLQQFLDQHAIPQIKGNPTTFLGIARQPHYENVLSNIYAFFFNPNAEHGFQDLFIMSLLDCINSSSPGQSKDFSDFSDFTIETEFSTNKGGRIDLLLKNDTSAIIIENKIYHTLNNNLKDYWSTIINRIEDETRVIGIVLSLKEFSDTNHRHFINITHIQLLSKIMDNIGLYLLEASDKYLVFLKDLHQNIINLSHKIMNEADFNFFFHNQEKINQLVSYKNQITSHLKKEIETAGNSIEECEVKTQRGGSYNENRLRFYTSKKNPDLMLTVVFEKLMTSDRKFVIIIELQGKALSFRDRIDVDKHKSSTTLTFNSDFKTTKKTYAHLAHKWYSPTEDEIFQLSDFIKNVLNQDNFLEVFRDLDNFLTLKRDET